MNKILATMRGVTHLGARLEKPDSSNRGAALLLMRVRKIAMEELVQTTPLTDPSVTPLPRLAIVPQEEESASSLSEDGDYLDSDIESCHMPTPRCRLVSVGSLDLEVNQETISPGTSSQSEVFSQPFHKTSAPSLEPPDLQDDLKAKNFAAESPPENLSDCGGGGNAHRVSRRFVGEHVQCPVRGVLRKKFSWKNYPELENYLIENRAQYLQYSSRLNYTAAQKLYNNQLTQGLLDLASEQGYVFDSFTFPAVRDRIRCYYKSFVQAGKKLKRKKRR